jgi:hypothetical protein
VNSFVSLTGCTVLFQARSYNKTTSTSTTTTTTHRTSFSHHNCFYLSSSSLYKKLNLNFNPITVKFKFKMRFIFGSSLVVVVAVTAVAIIDVTTTVEASASASASASIRVQHEQQHNDKQPQRSQGVRSPRSHRSHRRLSLPKDTECTLYKKDTQWEDGHADEVWSCEFTKEQATVMEAGLNTSTLGIVDMIDIDSIITKEELDSTGIISGTSVLKSSSLVVEKSNETGGMKLIVPESSSYEVKELSEDDRRHYKARRARRRSLQVQQSVVETVDYVGHRNLANSKGTLDTLVVRVKANNGSEPASEMQLYEDIFADSVCLKSQYAACSKDQLIINPAPGYGSPTSSTSGEFTGIVTVEVDVDSSKRDVLQDNALSVSESQYGPLSQNFDLVMYCQPGK